MAPKTLKKGGSYRKKTSKKTSKKTGKKGGMDNTKKPGLGTRLYRRAMNMTGRKTMGQEIEEHDARDKALKDALEEKRMKNQAIMDKDNNPEIDGRALYSMVSKKVKTPEELTEEQKNILDDGHFYKYDSYDNERIDLGKATKEHMEYGQLTQGVPVYMVEFCKDGDCSHDDVAVGSDSYSFRYQLNKPPAPPSKEQPGGYLKKNKSKANKGSKKNKKSDK